jgi:Flp pilus assembly pilin Flp
MMSYAKSFITNESGVAAIEYALILAGIGVVSVACLELIFALTSWLFASATANLVPISPSGH